MRPESCPWRRASQPDGVTSTGSPMAIWPIDLTPRSGELGHAAICSQSAGDLWPGPDAGASGRGSPRWIRTGPPVCRVAGGVGTVGDARDLDGRGAMGWGRGVRGEGAGGGPPSVRVRPRTGRLPSTARQARATHAAPRGRVVGAVAAPARRGRDASGRGDPGDTYRPRIGRRGRMPREAPAGSAPAWGRGDPWTSPLSAGTSRIPVGRMRSARDRRLCGRDRRAWRPLADTSVTRHAVLTGRVRRCPSTARQGIATRRSERGRTGRSPAGPAEERAMCAIGPGRMAAAALFPGCPAPSRRGATRARAGHAQPPDRPGTASPRRMAAAGTAPVRPRRRTARVHRRRTVPCGPGSPATAAIAIPPGRARSTAPVVNPSANPRRFRSAIEHPCPARPDPVSKSNRPGEDRLCRWTRPFVMPPSGRTAVS